MTNLPPQRQPETPAGGQIPFTGRSWISAPFRAVAILTGFMLLTVPCMPVQWALLKLAPNQARRFPHWYHRRVCRLLGIRFKVEGEIAQSRRVLLVSNHVSWLDIPVLSALSPLSFVAKSEVSKWPFVSWLAKLQRTVFIDRTRRADVGTVSSQMRRRLEDGDVLVLFAEGTSTDGNRVLPFKSALLSPAFVQSDAAKSGPQVDVQTLSLVYTHIHGVPLGRADRSLIGWYGDMEMGGHAWQLLKAGPIDVHIKIGAPESFETFANRKELAQITEQRVRDNVATTLRGR
ncbi:MAG: lysophospholipid acyltransferase family protein [Hyphomicrobiaceae bacterium]